MLTGKEQIVSVCRPQPCLNRKPATLNRKTHRLPLTISLSILIINANLSTECDHLNPSNLHKSKIKLNKKRKVNPVRDLFCAYKGMALDPYISTTMPIILYELMKSILMVSCMYYVLISLKINMLYFFVVSEWGMIDSLLLCLLKNLF